MAPKVILMYPSPPCRAVLMVAKAIGLELDIEEIERDKLKTPEYLELNPQHTVPILLDDEFVLWDSHAIAGYLVGKYAENDSLYPKEDLQKRALIDQRLHFDNGTLFQRMIVAAMPIFMGTGDFTDENRDKFVEAYGFLEAFLQGHPWIVGDDLTIADLSILTTISAMELFLPIDQEQFPNLYDWYQRGKELSYFDECNALGLEKLKNLLPNAE